MKIKSLMMLVFPVMMLTSCHDHKTAANKHNFEQALNRHYEKYCSITVGESRYRHEFPITLDIHDHNSSAAISLWGEGDNEESKKWDALVEAGLLKVKDQNGTERVWGNSRLTHQKVYSPTAKGQAALLRGTIFCAGHYQVANIKDFVMMNATDDGINASEVSFTLSPHNLADWAQNASLQKQWPDLKAQLQTDQSARMVLLQTNKGWSTEEDYYSTVPGG